MSSSMAVEYNEWQLMSPVHCAIRCTNTEYLKLLIKAGDGQFAKEEQEGKFVDARNEGGWTAAMLASRHGKYDALKLLIVEICTAPPRLALPLTASTSDWPGAVPPNPMSNVPTGWA